MQIIRQLSEPFEGKSTVALGFFDGVHMAHRAVISRALTARKAGERCIVFSFSTGKARPTKKQSAKWLMTEQQKEAALEGMGVDVFLEPPFEDICSFTPEEYADYLVNGLNVTTVACGYDYRFGKGAAGTADDLVSMLTPLGIDVEKVPVVLDGGEPVSSTRIRALLQDGHPEEAARLLGTPFSLCSPVVHGRGIGHSLGFPTANQRFPEGLIVPRNGVYATRVWVDGSAYPAVTNVGYKPTVGDTLPGAESCLLDFSGDLYEKEIRTEFLHFLRDEHKFDSLEELSAQISRDADETRKLVAIEKAGQ